MTTLLQDLACNPNSTNSSLALLMSLEPCYYGRKFNVYTLSCDSIPGFGEGTVIQLSDNTTILIMVVVIIFLFFILTLLLSLFIDTRKMRKFVFEKNKIPV